MQINKEKKKSSEVRNTAYYMSVVELELLIRLGESQANISSEPDAVSRVSLVDSRSQSTKKWQDKKRVEFMDSHRMKQMCWLWC